MAGITGKTGNAGRWDPAPEMAQCEPSDSTAVCGWVMRALCEGPEGEPRWAADVRLGDSVRIVRKTAQE